MKTINDKRKELEIRASTLIERKIHEYLKKQDNVTLALPGGSSVSGILSLLKRQKIPWHKVHIFMVDERIVPLNDDKSNYKILSDNLLDYLLKQRLIPGRNLHPYIYFNLQPQQGTDAYKNELREISHRFDIVLLSAGEEGHVASLFPNHETIKNQTDFFIFTDSSPKIPQKRISSSRKLLQKSGTALLLFLGDKKKNAYNNFKNNELSIIDCPAKLVKDIQDSYVFTDLS